MPDSPPSVTGAGPSIALRSVHKAFGKVHAVRGVDLELDRRQTVALLGPNGAGKSTLLEMVLGLSVPDGGSVSVLGLTPDQAVSEGRIAAMLQTGSPLGQVTVRELVSMYASLYRTPVAVTRTLELAGLESIADRRTDGLSGGQAQRIRFALALVTGAEVLVLDEPTVALDVESRRDFWDTMRRVAADGTTIVFATHYLEEADAFADRIVLMANGTIVAEGSATEIRSLVGTRRIRCTLPDVTVDELGTLPGVSSAERHGASIGLVCTDGDQALRALVQRFPAAADFDVCGAGLEDVFLELTSKRSAS